MDVFSLLGYNFVALPCGEIRDGEYSTVFALAKE